MGVDFFLDRVGESSQQNIKSKVPQNYGGGWFKQFTEFNPPYREESKNTIYRVSQKLQFYQNCFKNGT